MPLINVIETISGERQAQVSKIPLAGGAQPGGQVAPSEVIVQVYPSARLRPGRLRPGRRFTPGSLGRLAAVLVAGVIPIAVAAAAPPPDAAVKLVPVALQAPDASAPGGDGSAAQPGSPIEARIESTARLAISGEKLHADALRQFYAMHDWQPVWPSHPEVAKALRAAVMASGEQGLDPALFHGALLRDLSALSPIDQELVQTDAFLAYADALARGALPVEDRFDDEDLSPGLVDIPATLDKAIASPDPAGVIAALAPGSAEYTGLREALARYRTGPADSRTATKLAAIEVNLERLRWLPRRLPPDRVWVNTAAARLVLYRGDAPAFTTRVIVGEIDNQTPEFQTTIESVLFNPPWNIPPTIAAKEILPKLAMDPNYLEEHHMRWRTARALQQIAGPHSALGRLKFEMNDRFDVYLHDTPEHYLFSRDNRRRSHGCVRVQEPRELAARLLDEPVAEINEQIAQGTTHRRMLAAPMPVFIVYQTAVAEADGKIRFFADVYDRDSEIWRRLHPTQPMPMVAHELGSERPG